MPKQADRSKFPRLKPEEKNRIYDQLYQIVLRLIAIEDFERPKPGELTHLYSDDLEPLVLTGLNLHDETDLSLRLRRAFWQTNPTDDGFVVLQVSLQGKYGPRNTYINYVRVDRGSPDYEGATAI